ncbi:MAG TPA: hypothetical protein VIE12_10990 [Actinomycetota bacterium]
MDRPELAYAILPFVVLLVLGCGFWLVFRQRARARAGSRSEPALAGSAPAVPARDPGRAQARPWWGNPWLWVGVSAVFVVLGIFVWPGLFGGVVLFLPFVWVSRPRPPEMDPRTNGHSRRDGAVGR